MAIKAGSLWLAVSLLMLMASSAMSGDLKVGVVDFQQVVTEYEGYDDAASIFNKDVETWMSQKQSMLDEFMAARQDLQRKRALLTPEAVSEKEAELAQMEAEVYSFEQEKFGPEGEATRRHLELTEPLMERVRETVKLVAEEDGYDLVLDVSGVVLYLRPEMNIDERVKAALR